MHSFALQSKLALLVFLESELRALLSVAKVKDGRAGWVCEDELLSVEWRPERNHTHKARAAETARAVP